jgi:hypothetical protein
MLPAEELPPGYPVDRPVNPRWYELVKGMLTIVSGRRPAAEWPVVLDIVRQATPHRSREIETMVKTIAHEWMEEGITEGERRASRTLLRALLEDRFGTLPETLVEAIQTTNEVERLQTAARQVPRLQRLDDLSLR